MKKNLLFILLLVFVTILLPAQTNTGVGFVEDIEEFDIGFTDYDMQTNSNQRNQMVTWEDGWIGAVFIQATGVVAPAQSFPNRGTGYAYYDGTTWHPSTGRVENERTGFGTVCRYKENEVLICAHNSNSIVLYKSPRDGSNWQKLNLPAVAGTVWPSVMTSGPNRDIIHVIVSCAPNSTSDSLWYFRSSNGTTWDKYKIKIPYLMNPYAQPGKLNANNANFMETTSPTHPVIPNRLAFVLTTMYTDGEVIYSDDNGETWNRKVFYQHPDPLASAIPADGWYYPRAASAAWDAQGKLHLAYEFGWMDDGHYRPGSGVAYWNETMPVLTQNDFESLFFSHWIFSGAEPPMAPEFFGYFIPMDDELYFETGEILPDNVVDLWERGGTYLPSGMPHHNYRNQAILAFPSIAIDQAGTIYCVYACLTEFTLSYWSEEVYYRLFARSSADNGQTWSAIEMLTKGSAHEEDECIFTSMSYNAIKTYGTGTYMHVIYQQDDYPGMYLALGDGSPDHDPNGTKMVALKVKIPTNTPATPCEPVENLAGDFNEGTKKVTLTWEAPETMVPVSYTIQRNGPTPKTVTVSAPATSYLDDVAAVQTGDYTYCVTPVYTSDICNLPAQQKCITALHIIGIDPCEPVASIEGEYNSDNVEVTITWTVPATMVPVEYIIMRGEEVLETVEATVMEYKDDVSGFAEGTYTYCVIPVYTEGDCAGSDPKCIDVFVPNSIKEISKISFSIVPNPASAQITVTAANNFHTVEVLGFLGQTIYTQSNIGNKTTLDVSNYANGVYFVRIISENGVSVNKFVKQ